MTYIETALKLLVGWRRLRLYNMCSLERDLQLLIEMSILARGTRNWQCTQSGPQGLMALSLWSKQASLTRSSPVVTKPVLSPNITLRIGGLNRRMQLPLGLE